MGFIQWLGGIAVFVITGWLTLGIWQWNAIFAGIAIIVAMVAYISWIARRNGMP